MSGNFRFVRFALPDLGSYGREAGMVNQGLSASLS